MVAPRSTTAHASNNPPADNTRPASVTTARHHEEPVSYTRYSHPIDQSVARVMPNGVVETYVYHECFSEVETLSEVEQKEFRIKQYALRVAAGLEMRSLRTLAKELHCTHQAIHNATLRLCDRLGIRHYSVSDTTRQRQSEARRRQLASR